MQVTRTVLTPLNLDLKRFAVSVYHVDGDETVLSIVHVLQALLQTLIKSRSSPTKMCYTSRPTMHCRRLWKSLEAKDVERVSNESSVDSHKDVAEKLAGVEDAVCLDDRSIDKAVIDLNRSTPAARRNEFSAFPRV